MESQQLNTRRYIGCAKHVHTTDRSHQEDHNKCKHTGDSPTDGIKPPSAIEYTYISERQHASEAINSKVDQPVRQLTPVRALSPSGARTLRVQCCGNVLGDPKDVAEFSTEMGCEAGISIRDDLFG